jgi:hypothetical protein
MSVYDTVKQYFLPLTKWAVGPLPIKTDKEKIFFSPKAKGLAITFYNILPYSIEKEHGN